LVSSANLKRGAIYALAAAAGLGAVTTQAKFVYADGGNALTLILWRFAISGAAIGIVILVKRYSFKIDREYRRSTLLLGVIWSGAMICYLLSIETISVSLAVLILYSYPVLVLLVSLLQGILKPSLALVGVFVLAFTGIALMLGGIEMQFSAAGVIFALLAASGAAYTFLKGSAIAPLMNPVVLTFWVNLLGIFIILPMVYGNYAMPVSSTGMLYLAGATLCYLVAILAQFEALAILSAARAAFIFNLEPVVSILLALVFLGETLTVIQWVGATMVIAVLFSFNRISGTSAQAAEPSR
jgi:drug/metabolite transporter (DMT)-like permease